MFVIDHVLPTISPNFFIYIPVLFALFLVALYSLLQKFRGCKRFCLNPVVLIGIANITVWMNSIKDTAVWKLNYFHIFHIHIRNNSRNIEVIQKTRSYKMQFFNIPNVIFRDTYAMGWELLHRPLLFWLLYWYNSRSEWLPLLLSLHVSGYSCWTWMLFSRTCL